ncbi:MAG TPA: hypothetical protein VFL82_10940 [Thermomicrobiales bacterium]|nr:hypothetical protein [Thermomicrobiales bacterium]
MHLRERVSHGILIAIAALLILTGNALAQSSESTITITVLEPPNPCVPAEDMTVLAQANGDAIEVPYGSSDSDNDYYSSFQINVENASCNPWSISAELSEFTLTSDTSKTFPGSTLVLDRLDQGFPNPNTWDDQPAWVQNLPADLATGDPTMPDQVTFSGSSPAVGSDALLTASTAEYGSPGNYSVYYWTSLTNVPTDLTPGSYEAKITITVAGND